MNIKEKYDSFINEENKSNPYDDMGKEIINNINQYGLGTISKSDLEGLIFHAICNAIEKNEMINTHNQDYEIMQMLRISPSKLRSLRVTRSAKYLSDLDYNSNSNKFRILNALKRASVGNCDIENGKISISISDPHTQNLIEHMIEDNQGIVEHSINPKLLSLNSKEFLKIVAQIYGDNGEDGYEKIIEGIKNEVKDIHEELTKDNIFDEFKKAFKDQAFDELAKISLKLIEKAIKHKMGIE